MASKEYLEQVEQILSSQPVETDEPRLIDLPDLFEGVQRQERVETIPIPRSRFLNEAIGGLRVGDMTAYCGMTGAGKTTQMATWATGFIEANVPLFIASIEIGAQAFLAKMASSLSGKRAIETREEWKEVAGKFGASHFSNPAHQFSTYNSRVNPRRLMADILWAKEHRGTKVAIVDNFNFASEVADSRDAVAQMDRAVHDWIVFIREIGVHLIMIFHPRKPDSRESERVRSIYELKGSSTVVQEAQNVLLFNRLEKPEHAPHGRDPELCRELKVMKCRSNGRAVGKRIIYAIDNVSEAYSEVRILRDND